jgi:hypothetical protein
VYWNLILMFVSNFFDVFKSPYAQYQFVISSIIISPSVLCTLLPFKDKPTSFREDILQILMEIQREENTKKYYPIVFFIPKSRTLGIKFYISNLNTFCSLWFMIWYLSTSVTKGKRHSDKARVTWICGSHKITVKSTIFRDVTRRSPGWKKK